MIENKNFIGRVIEIDNLIDARELVFDSAIEKVLKMDWKLTRKNREELHRIGNDTCSAILQDMANVVALSVLDLKLPADRIVFSNLPPHKKSRNVIGENNCLVLWRHMDYQEAMFIRDYLWFMLPSLMAKALNINDGRFFYNNFSKGDQIRNEWEELTERIRENGEINWNLRAKNMMLHNFSSN